MRRINNRIKSLWGISEIGFSVMSMMETSFFLYYLTDIAHLPLSTASIISGIGAAFDAVCAVFSGYVIDSTHLRSGRYRPWLLYCPPFVLISFVFCFTKIGSNLVASFFIILGYITSHFLWTIAWNANRGLISVLTEDQQEQNFLSGRIALGTSCGKIFGSFFIPYMSVKIGKLVHGIGSYTIICALSCLAFWGCYYVHYRITEGYDTEPGMRGKKKPSIFELIHCLSINENLLAVFLYDTVRQVSFLGISASCIYYSRIVLEKSEYLSWILVIIYCGNAFGSFLSNRIADKTEARGAAVIGCLGCGLLHGSCYFLSGHMIASAIVLFLSQSFFGIAYGVTTKLYSICGTYGEWKTGNNTRGVILSFGALSVKLAVAIRAVIISLSLGMIHYDSTVSVITQAEKNTIRILFFIIFSLIMMASAIPAMKIRLNSSRVAEMENEIALRNRMQ